MGERELRFERRMSEQEALMWALDQDPVLRSSFANLTFLDHAPDPERLRDRMAEAVRRVPRLRQRVEPGTGPSAPSWADDAWFDLDHHLRRVAVPHPGSERQVLDLAAQLSGDPFDRARPLWQFVVIEGLADGRAAMVQRLHHAVVDGEGGVRLSASFLDVERDPEPAGRAEPVPDVPETPGRSPVAAVRDTLVAGVRAPADLARRAIADAGHALGNPLDAPARAGDALETARSVIRQMAVADSARSPLWLERSLRRHLEVLSIPLDAARVASAALGGTVNDLFVAGAAAAAGDYHRARGVDVEELRVAMPVSTRGGTAQAGANAFAPTRVVVPVDGTDARAHFTAVAEVLRGAKSERAVALVPRLAAAVNVLPPSMVLRAARQQAGTVDFATSNVRGAPFDLYIAGARILANHPIGPLAGTAFNLTTLSYGGNLHMGCLVDPAAVDDPGLLGRCLVDAYDRLLALAPS